MIGFANAKINLGLDIVRKRHDGYHDISTVFYPISLMDVVEIVPSQSGITTLTCYGRKIDCEPEKNLMMKACRLMQQRYGAGEVDMYLYKHIPDGAGLGGGSSDASKVMLMLAEMFSLPVTQEELATAATEIGADCPFFIYNEPALAEGIGNLLTPCEVNLKDKTLLLVKPAISVPTKDAYAQVTPKLPATHITQIVRKDIGLWQKRLKNDFEPSVFAQYPELGELKRTIQESGALYAAMSGSGSSIYGIFSSAKLAEAASAKIQECDKFVIAL